jgi:hypothetical protein
MAKEKNKPVPVRFNLKLLEVLKEEEKIDTPQQALNFLAHFWENNRPAKDGVAYAPSVASDRKAAEEGNVAEEGKDVPKKGGRPQTKEGGTASHPSGLSGIDLSIWKAEQKEKGLPG